MWGYVLDSCGVEQLLVNTVMSSQVPYEAGYALTL
jgi:hypothetical protein